MFTFTDITITAIMFNRKTHINKVERAAEWDMVVIGGGATGLGIAVDAASRGFKTLLLEKDDFAKGTSSRSTKLVHGGVRYLANGDIKLVYSALKERWYIFQNAAHVSRVQSFVIPCYSFVDKWKYLIGLKMYDWLAGKFSIGRSKFLSPNQVRENLGNISPAQLRGGVRYFDGQFDDARMAINLAQTAIEQGATVLNYASVVALLKDKSGKVSGVEFIDRETDVLYKVNAKVVVNATGIFVDDILSMDNKVHKKLVRPSQGSHIVVDMSFLPKGTDALMIPKTSDGRVLFGVPWHGHLVLGTTDTALDEKSEEPRPLEEEINFILDTAKNYLAKAPECKDVLSIFAGLRPLAANNGNEQKTKEISRDHKLIIHGSNLITITGGKWTTYRKMAEETVNSAIEVGRLHPSDCITKNLMIHGCAPHLEDSDRLAIYGTDAADIRELIRSSAYFAEKIHHKHKYTIAEVIWSVRNEMARTVEDVLARRIRLLFLDAAAALESAPLVAETMAKELGHGQAWIEKQLSNFEKLAQGYLLNKKSISLDKQL